MDDLHFTSGPILSVRDLTVSFMSGGSESRPVVDGISFDVHAGETVAIVGESGSGKSVTSLSIMRLLSSGSSRIKGQVLLNGRSLLELPESEMRRVRGNEIGMIFQEPMTSLNPVIKVGQQISESLILHRGMSQKDALAEAARLLDKVRIPAAMDRLNDFPHQFSGGMRQRVMIAMALACRPKLLIADEPTTALDVTIQGQIIDLIRELQKEERTSVLFITHDMGVVAEIADRTMVMYKGQIVEEGTTLDIFQRPQRPYTRSLLASVPILGSMGGRAFTAKFPVVDRESGEAQPPQDCPDTVETSGPPVLEVDNLSTYFAIKRNLFGRSSGSVHAVEGVSFALRPGETLSLVGESGCGKSTTGRTILGLTKRAAGTIRIEGQDVTRFGKAEQARVRSAAQMIFQDPFASLNPRMQIGKAIAEPMVVHRVCDAAEARERVLKLLDVVGLDRSMIDRYPHEFSGGQRQRICIARALALTPKVIIADEAVSALDVTVKAQVLNLMLDLQQRLKLSYLFISHDIAAVERISHRIAVMYLGEIVEIGPRAAIFESPQHAYTRKLLSAVSIPDPTKRRERAVGIADELKSPIRPRDYKPAARQIRQVGVDHFVQA
ncbi:ABC transporter ATP-binding protein [Rhizobium puerariae]|uniref:Glutathione import ATP-binding protein GsiA n=1 Tax=Rhizobium puerariae TaxID=1585791 RepID=A0ABV6AQ03_9HYPH